MFCIEDFCKCVDVRRTKSFCFVLDCQTEKDKCFAVKWRAKVETWFQLINGGCGW